MKTTHLFLLFVLLGLTSLTFAQEAEQETSPIDKIQFWDGNNNYYVVLPYKINYSPVLKEHSSSGEYSGGKPQSKKMKEGDFEKLSKAVKKIYDDESIRIDKREKGTIKLQIEHQSGLVEYIFIKAGKDANKVEKMIKKRLK